MNHKIAWLESQGWKPLPDRKYWWKNGNDHSTLDELPDPPYPEHTPPAPPEGMKWEYRGMNWRNPGPTTFYFIKNDGGNAVRIREVLSGLGHHYFEGVPILDAESGFDFPPNLFSENPKESEGQKKCPMQLLPPEFLIQTANVMGYGAYDAPRSNGEGNGYGPWNWRDQPIKMSTYLGAILRHWSKILEGDLVDKTHGQSHFASIAANCAIVLDALKYGTMVDDRPTKHDS